MQRHTESIFKHNQSLIIEKIFRKLQKFLERHPSIASSAENKVQELVGEKT